MPSAEKGLPMRLQITEVDHDANAFWTLDSKRRLREEIARVVRGGEPQ
jgi:hypothetical protein